MTANDLLIKNARIIDPASGTDKIGDILIEGGIIKQLGVNITAPALQTVDATGLIACPGFIDLHCHLRQPGNENKETIASGSAAASRGGFTTICCMPNTNPTAGQRSPYQLCVKHCCHRGAQYYDPADRMHNQKACRG